MGEAPKHIFVLWKEGWEGVGREGRDLCGVVLRTQRNLNKGDACPSNRGCVVMHHQQHQTAVKKGLKSGLCAVYGRGHGNGKMADTVPRRQLH